MSRKTPAPTWTEKANYCCRATLNLAREEKIRRHGERLVRLQQGYHDRLKQFDEKWMVKLKENDNTGNLKAQEAALIVKENHDKEMEALMAKMDRREAKNGMNEDKWRAVEEHLLKKGKHGVIKAHRESRKEKEEFHARRNEFMQHKGPMILRAEQHKAMVKALHPYVQRREALLAQYHRERENLLPQHAAMETHAEEEHAAAMESFTRMDVTALPLMCSHHFHLTTPVQALDTDFYHCQTVVTSPSKL